MQLIVRFGCIAVGLVLKYYRGSHLTVVVDLTETVDSQCGLI